MNDKALLRSASVKYSNKKILNEKTVANLNTKINQPFTLKLIFILTTFFVINIILIQSAKADVISVNSGGSNSTAVIPNDLIEGFFSQIPVPPVVVTPPGGGGGGAGGGGGGGGGLPPANIQIIPSEFNINIAVNTTIERTITVTNLGNDTVTVFVVNQNLENHVIIETQNVTIPAGQSAPVKVVFVALSQPGIVTGRITVGGQPILVSLNIKTSLLLFDSNIVVLNPNYQVQQGDQLQTRVTLIPLGSQENTDIGLSFTIRDYNGKIYLTKSETMMINRLTSLDRNFDTGIIAPGKYIIGLELTYGNAVAPSSAHFEVIKKKPINFLNQLVIYLSLLILLILIVILIIVIQRRIRKIREEEEAETTV